MANQEGEFWVFHILWPLLDTCSHSYCTLKDPYHSCQRDSTCPHCSNSFGQKKCFPVRKCFNQQLTSYYFSLLYTITNPLKFTKKHERRKNLSNSFRLPANRVIFCHEHVHLWSTKAIKILRNILVVVRHCKKEVRSILEWIFLEDKTNLKWLKNTWEDQIRSIQQ